MIANWMIYGTAVSLLLGMAALAAEHALLRWKLPTRIAWMVSLGALFLVPLVTAAFRPERSPTPVEINVTADALPAVAGSFAPAATGQWLRSPVAPVSWDSRLLALWVVLSIGLANFILVSYASVRRQRRKWRWSTVEGAKVLVSDHTGPAVVGFFPGEVVVPEWVSEFAPADREMLIRHELEHVRARDPLLLLLGLIAVVLVPWNLAGWWQLRRLRAAIEVDCDRRVLGSSEMVGSYGSLLLTVAGRSGRIPLGAAAFSTGSGQLRRRLEIMMTRAYRHRVAIGLATAVMAGALVLVACNIELPMVVRDNIIRELAASVPDTTVEQRQQEDNRPRGAAGDTVMLEIVNPEKERPGAVGERSTTNIVAGDTIYKVSELAPDSRPNIINRAQLPGIMAQFYPRILRDAGVAGRVVARAVVAPDGRIDPKSIEIIESSHPLFAEATRQALERFTFRPGRYEGRNVAVSIELPITWQAGSF